MIEHEEWESDEALASAANIPAFDAAKREALAAATARIIRRRRARHIVMQAAAIIVAFVSGMFAMNQIRESTPSPAEQNSPLAAATPLEPQSIKPPAVDSAIFADPEALARAYDAASPDERLALLKRAGDYALNERGDLRDALEYYRQWIRLADPPVRSKYDDTDTWLLASLKHDQ